MDKCEYACSKNAMTKEKKRDTKKKNYEFRALLQFCLCYCCCGVAAALLLILPLAMFLGWVHLCRLSMPFALCALRYHSHCWVCLGVGVQSF